MPRLLLSLLFAGLLAAHALAQDFMPGFEDIPIMKGMEVVPGSGHVFDSPAGRLVESHAQGNATRGKVEAFYSETLPALGWQRISAGKYRREKESLRITTSGEGRNLTVIYRLSPSRP
jgi:hypothetical protein